MAWIYLAVLEDLRSRSKPGYDPSHIVKTTDTHRPYFCHACGAETFPDLQSGTTCEHLRAINSQAQSTLSTADSPVRTSHVPALESAWAASDQDFSSTSQGLSAKQTRDLYFSKTSQQLELVASTVSSKHLPSSGMIVDGRLFQPQKLAPGILDKDGFYWPTLRTTGLDGGSNSRKAIRRREMLPTLLARDCRTVKGAKPRPGKQGGPNLVTMLGGPVNPKWAEWFMGYPVGHTSLEDWAMQWFRSKRKSRSKD